MGSLMAGWDSPSHDPKHVAFQRNRSFTKEAVEAYWRRKERSESDKDKHQRSNSVPTYGAKEEVVSEMEAKAAWGKLIDRNGWWRRSNLAFLNEPPVLEGGSNNSYMSQYHVSNVNN